MANVPVTILLYMLNPLKVVTRILMTVELLMTLEEIKLGAAQMEVVFVTESPNEVKKKIVLNLTNDFKSTPIKP